MFTGYISGGMNHIINLEGTGGGGGVSTPREDFG